MLKVFSIVKFIMSVSFVYNPFKKVYIEAGDSYDFSVPNGTYQVFFYGGEGWNPHNKMTGGYVGGFVANESYSKDPSVALNYQGVSYE